MSNSRTKLLAILFLVVYTAIGLGAHFFADKMRGVYPFFSWFLFVEVPPRTQTNFEFFVTEFNGKPVFPPVSPQALPGFSMGAGAAKKRSHFLTERLGRALESGNQREVGDVRRELESHFGGITSYEIRRTHFSPISRLLYGTVASESVVASFKVNFQ